MNYIDTEHRDLPHELVQANYDVIKKYIRDRLSLKQMLTVCSDQYFIVISNDPAAKLSSRISRLSEDLKSMYQLPLLCCIGNEYTNYLDIPKSFNEADTIFRYLDHNRPGIFLYSTITLDFTVNQIPVVHRRNLYQEVFHGCTAEETEAFCDLIINYFKCNGSLVQLAKLYFIHKNTVQYKIQAVHKRTGYDLRILHDLFILYLAASYKISI